MAASSMKALAATLYGIVVPGTLTVVMPWLLFWTSSRTTDDALPWLRHSGWLLVVSGALLIGWCIHDLLVRGQGTPAPSAPPARLVTGGLYRWTRNPMYVGIVLMLLGEALVFWSPPIALATAATWLCMTVYLLTVEERGLRRRFGHAYEIYQREVPRWIGWPWPRR